MRFCYVILLFFIVSCASAPEKKESKTDYSKIRENAKQSFYDDAPPKKNISKTPPPDWINQTSYQKNDGIISFVGKSYNIQNREKAEQLSFLNALSELAMYFGIEVKSKLTNVEQEANGEYSYKIENRNDITSKPIRINKFNKAGVFTEETEKGFNSYTLITISEKEANRIEKEIKGIAGWAVIVENSAFSEMLKDFLKLYAKGKKIKIGNNVLIQKDSAIEDIAASSDTAYFLTAEAAWDKPVQEGKAFFAKVRVKVRLFSLIDMKEIDTVIEEVKSGEYSEEYCIRAGIKKATKKILDNIE